ncbi:hypothetical protein PIB30_072037 [Stylosanthes scabra]|uniref:ABC transmembrane type-1 domain-containing protein n=1 Tax=Stylosanthes scabra TaxID=79078 RepID=A0ABU6SQP4_9FABA|nr:hypothetical protein [Stylosanthes scabra]
MGKKSGLFSYADGVDKLLLLFGTLGCIGDGLQTPITMFVFGSLINDYASGSGDSVPKHIIDKHALNLLCIAIGVAVSSFVAQNQGANGSQNPGLIFFLFYFTSTHAVVIHTATPASSSSFSFSLCHLHLMPPTLLPSSSRSVPPPLDLQPRAFVGSDDDRLKVLEGNDQVQERRFHLSLPLLRPLPRDGSCLRASVLKQDVGFFDKQTDNDSAKTFQIISTITSDAQTIQDTMAEKIPNCLVHLSALFSSFIVGFFLSWRLVIAAFPFSIMMIMPAIIFGKVMKDLGGKMKDAYGVAGHIAEQAISSVRTVYSYVAEKETLKRFSSALERSMELGIKVGRTKGVVIGSFGLLYCTWAFQSWVGSVLVRTKGEKGGLVFAAEICMMWGGL